MAYQNAKQLMSNCENPAAYDFTLECDHEDYEALSPFERFLTYKSTAVGERILSDIEMGEPDERIAEGFYHEVADFCVDNCRKYPDLTDWDGWDGKCKLAVNIYEYLWGWKAPSGERSAVSTADIHERLWGWRDDEQRRYSSLFRTVKPFGALGGDTLNSAQTTLNCYLEALKDEQGVYGKQLLPNPRNPKKSGNVSIRFCIQLYRIFGKDFIEQLAGNEELSCFIQLTHTMGNLMLVPAGYNYYRGRANQIHDYADLSLYNLLHNCDGNSGRFLGKDEETRKRNGTRYINFSFLWDYVEKTGEGTYEALPLCDSHRLKMQTWDVMDVWDEKNVLPKKEELEELCKNINCRIIRRGRFMAAMLVISVNYPDVYTRLVQEVFLTERVYDGYGEVKEAIREKLHTCASDVCEAVAAILENLKEHKSYLKLKFGF